MATTTIWNNKDGDQQKRTEWHRVVVWAKQAEIAGEYLKKGSQVHVEGSLQTREWTDREGGKRYTTEIRAQRIQMLGKPKDQPVDEPPATDEPPAPETPPDDIPF